MESFLLRMPELSFLSAYFKDKTWQHYVIQIPLLLKSLVNFNGRKAIIVYLSLKVFSFKKIPPSETRFFVFVFVFSLQIIFGSRYSLSDI